MKQNKNKMRGINYLNWFTIYNYTTHAPRYVPSNSLPTSHEYFTHYSEANRPMTHTCIHSSGM